MRRLGCIWCWWLGGLLGEWIPLCIIYALCTEQCQKITFKTWSETHLLRYECLEVFLQHYWPLTFYVECVYYTNVFGMKVGVALTITCFTGLQKNIFFRSWGFDILWFLKCRFVPDTSPVQWSPSLGGLLQLSGSWHRATNHLSSSLHPAFWWFPAAEHIFVAPKGSEKRTKRVYSYSLTFLSECKLNL